MPTFDSHGAAAAMPATSTSDSTSFPAAAAAAAAPSPVASELGSPASLAAFGVPQATSEPISQLQEVLAPARLQAPRTVASATPATAPRQPVRVHAEWQADGVRVWLGLDAAALPEQQAIAQQVRQWAVAQGVKLVSLSCNGTQVEDDGESPAPGPDREIPRSADVNPKENA